MQPTFDEQAAASIQLIDRRSAGIQRAPINTDPLLAVMDKLANNPNLDADKIERLMNVFLDGQRKLTEMQDEKLFSDAMADFKNEPDVVRILKDKKNKQYGNSPYASLGQEASVITPLLSKHKLTATWTLAQSPKITIGCQLSYGIYHAPPVTIQLDPDNSGAKNPAQEIKSAITYGRIITLECACGVAPVDSLASLNDDGNALGVTLAEAESRMDERQAADYRASIDGSGSLAELEKNYLAAKDAADKARDMVAAKDFKDAANAMHKKLSAKAVR
jgi:hypothetical protein